MRSGIYDRESTNVSAGDIVAAIYPPLSRSLTLRVAIAAILTKGHAMKINLRRAKEKLIILKRERMEAATERIVSDLTPFKNLHKGRRCFIMGNGPSLNKMDLNLLKDEMVFGLNCCYLLFDRISWRPKYWVGVDTRVLPDRAKEICRMQSEFPEIVMFMPNQLVGHQPGGGIHLTTKFIPQGPNRYYFRQKSSAGELPWGAFSENIDDYCVIPHTVTVTALQIAYYMGFDPVYLIGCDTSFNVPKSVRRDGPSVRAGRPAEKNATDEDKEIFLTSTQDDDSNHFAPNYFGKGRKWHEPFLEKMIWHYEQVEAVAKARGWTVKNATVGGKLETFERVQFESLF